LIYQEILAMCLECIYKQNEWMEELTTSSRAKGSEKKAVKRNCQQNVVIVFWLHQFFCLFVELFPQSYIYACLRRKCSFSCMVLSFKFSYCVWQVNAFLIIGMFGMCALFLLLATFLQQYFMAIARFHKKSKF